MIRLSKLMAERGLCSRREADELIAQGLVTVNGAIVSILGSKVDVQSHIEIQRAGQRQLSQKVTILLNKPVGYVSSQPEDDYPAAVELISAKTQVICDQRHFHTRDLKGLAPVGRLDIDSRGLLILSQDGALVRKVIGPNSRIEKEYHVTVAGIISEKKLQQLRYGLSLDGKKLRPAKVDALTSARLRFILTEGKKRQIRRMCDAVGLTVRSLLRVRVGRIHLNDLPEGRWRYLKANETF